MIVQNVNRTAVNDISFTVDADELQEAVEVSQKFAFEVEAQKVAFDKGVAKLSVVGTGIVANAEIASKFFESLFELGINIQTISTSEIKISCLIAKERAKEAMIHIHLSLIHIYSAPSHWRRPQYWLSASYACFSIN